MKKPSLTQWLETHYEQHYWYKESYQHEGVGQRNPAEAQAAQERFQAEEAKLIQTYEDKRQQILAQWVANGMSLLKAQKRWEAKARQIHAEQRRNYAYQKD